MILFEHLKTLDIYHLAKYLAKVEYMNTTSTLIGMRFLSPDCMDDPADDSEAYRELVNQWQEELCKEFEDADTPTFTVEHDDK